MKEERLREQIGTRLGNKTELFISFFMKRFPDENGNITSYVSEWVDRFNKGNPELHMDTQSLAIYKELI